MKHSVVAGIAVGGVVIRWTTGIAGVAGVACTVASSTFLRGVAKSEITDACWVQIGMPCGGDIAVFMKACCLDRRGRGRRCCHELAQNGGGDHCGITATLIRVCSGIRDDVKH